MTVEQVMTRDIASVAPDSNLAHAAVMMGQRECGFLPVVEASGRLAGVITDRDICLAGAMRKVPAHRVPVQEVMTTRMALCSPMDDLRKAMHRMSEARVRRLPVVERDGRLCGILSLDDLAFALGRSDGPSAGEVLAVLKSVSAHHRHPAGAGA